MASATKIRPLARALDACDRPFWVIGPGNKLVYLSAAACRWLGVDGEALLGRQSFAGATISDDPLDYLAASLSAPPGFKETGLARLHVRPSNPQSSSQTSGIPAMDVRFVRLGDQDRVLTFAIAGEFADPLDREPSVNREVVDAVALREMLDRWRWRHASRAVIATAGDSVAARHVRQRLSVASAVRTHLGFYGVAGCGAESVARQVHQASAPKEPLVPIEGPLMDAELLEVSAAELLEHLAHSQQSQATLLVRGLDDMPIEAQQRLSEWMEGFGTRLRLIGLCSEMPSEFTEPLDWGKLPESEGRLVGLSPDLIEALSALSVRLPSLAERAEDIPMLATALLDRRRAGGESVAERFSRPALDKLVIYPWPGDFDELDQAIRHAVRVATAESIAVDHLPLAIRTFQVGQTSDVFEEMPPLDELVRRFEMRLIESALQSSDGNRAEAARRLGVSRARFLRKAQSFGIIDPPAQKD